MNNISEKERINALIDRKGIFGFGFSNNNHLDLLNLIVLACSGIIIAIFFRSKNDENYGLRGPASSIIWGYGITAIALFLLLFMSFYLKKREKDLTKNILEITKENGNSESENLFTVLVKLLLNDSLPILLVFSILVYAIILNYSYFIKINSGKIPNTYATYEFYFSILLIIQIGLIIKYMYNLLRKNDGLNNSINNKQTLLVKSLSYILCTVNFIFLLILHILLVFFSTDG